MIRGRRVREVVLLPRHQTTPPSPPDPNDKYGSPEPLHDAPQGGDWLILTRWTGGHGGPVHRSTSACVFTAAEHHAPRRWSHLFWDRQTFQGHPAEVVSSNTRGATRLRHRGQRRRVSSPEGRHRHAAPPGGGLAPPRKEPVSPERPSRGRETLRGHDRQGLNLVLLRTGYGLRKVTEGHPAPQRISGLSRGLPPPVLRAGGRGHWSRHGQRRTAIRA